jgi:hypothetical protein
MRGQSHSKAVGHPALFDNNPAFRPAFKKRKRFLFNNLIANRVGVFEKLSNPIEHFQVFCQISLSNSLLKITSIVCLASHPRTSLCLCLSMT